MLVIAILTNGNYKLDTFTIKIYLYIKSLFWVLKALFCSSNV